MSLGSSTRILIVGPYWGIEGWTQSTARALKDLGCTTQSFYYNGVSGWENLRNVKDQLSSVSRLPDGVRNLLTQVALLTMGYRTNARLIREAKLFRPDIILVLKGETLFPDTLRKLKKETRAVLITWWVDNPIRSNERHRWLLFPRCVPLFDAVFVFDRAYEPLLLELGAKQVNYLPCAADPHIYRSRNLTDHERSTYSSSVVMIASYYPKRGAIIRELLEEPGLAVWGGPDWKPFFDSLSEASHRVWRGGRLSPVFANVAYQAAGIVINVHHAQSKRGGLNMRAFETSAAGVVQLMDYVPEMEPLLSPGREVVCFSSQTEVRDLIRELLIDQELRRRIASAAQERVLDEHTFFHRMGQVLRTL